MSQSNDLGVPASPSRDPLQSSISATPANATRGPFKLGCAVIDVTPSGTFEFRIESDSLDGAKWAWECIHKAIQDAAQVCKERP